MGIRNSKYHMSNKEKAEHRINTIIGRVMRDNYSYEIAMDNMYNKQQQVIISIMNDLVVESKNTEHPDIAFNYMMLELKQFINEIEKDTSYGDSTYF